MKRKNKTKQNKKPRARNYQRKKEEANTLWTILDYLNFFLFYRVIRAKFPEEHRLFTDENSSVHCLAVLNRDCPDMFVLLYVDKNNDSAVSIVIYSFSQA